MARADSGPADQGNAEAAVAQQSESGFGVGQTPNETPAVKTEAQEEASAPLNDGPSDEAKRQQAEDDKWRLEHPNEVLMRGPNPEMGGESFAAYEEPVLADPAQVEPETQQG